MSKFGRTTMVAAVSATVLIGGTAAWAAYSWTHHSRVPVRTAGVVEPTVTVTGEVTGLLPGKTRPVRVVIKNSNEFPVRVTKISGGNAPTASGCQEWAVRVTPSDGSAYAVTIPRRSSRTMTIKIGMEDWADQKCAGQSFALDLTTFMTAA